MFGGGHRVLFCSHGDKTRVDHELEMNPRGIGVLMSPLMGMMAKKSLHNTAAALKHHLESRPPSERATGS